MADEDSVLMIVEKAGAATVKDVAAMVDVVAEREMLMQ